MLQRIMGVKYSFPSNLQLSKDCVDLISKVFVGNPANRINITGIRAHPWFLKNLPEELRVRCWCMCPWHTERATSGGASDASYRCRCSWFASHLDRSDSSASAARC